MAIGASPRGSDQIPLSSVQSPSSINPLPLQGGMQMTDAQGNVVAPAIVELDDSGKATYSAAITGLVPATTAGDIFVLSASATKTAKLTRCHVSGRATTAATFDFTLVKRSTADTAGTSSTPTITRHDTDDPAPTASVKAYTVAPTAGTLLGMLRSEKLLLPLSASAATEADVEWEFGIRPAKCPTLKKNTTECYAITISAIPAGGSLDISMEWTEEV